MLPLKKIKFQKLGFVDLDDNKRSKYQARELKSAYVDEMAILLKLVIHESYPNKLNLFN